MGKIQNSVPDPSSIDFFKNITSRHEKILRIEADMNCAQIFHAYRWNGDVISVYLTNLYTVGVADYLDIRNHHPEINCIVTVSAWNGYTSAAKNIALGEKVGLFVIAEYLGAMNVQEYWAYIKKNDKGDSR